MSAIAAARCSAMPWLPCSKVTGYDVSTEYYINDAGAQVDTVARSAFLRYQEALGTDIGEIPAGLYPGEYLMPVGQALAAEHGKNLLAMTEEQWLPIARTKAIAMMMDLIRGDLASLKIHQEVFFSERSLHDSREVRDTVADLRAAGHVYEGRLPPPKGELPEDWEDREQTLFRATAFGDDMDRPLAQVRRLLHLFRLRRCLQPQQDQARLQGTDLCSRRRPRRLCQKA